MKKIELLAPAGNFSCLAAAVQNGADAVYFAGKKFGARSFADNFDTEEIKKAIDYCHLRGVKTHIAVNTAYSDNEIEEVIDFINCVYSEGADALIISDVGLASLVRRNFPDIELHASTQMTIHNLDGVKFAKQNGFKRVVLSRELSFEDISYITQNTDMEIEVFAHGALCMSYSGQCLLSSMIGGRSGNRGSCAQPCRLPFSDDNNKEKRFLLSLKDLSLAEHIDDLVRVGVSSLKIEGRMKGPAYVSAVVGIYRKYIDNGLKIDTKDREILDGIFFRGGLTDGYFKGQKSKKMFDFNKPDNPYLKLTKEFNKIYSKDYINEENKKIDINMEFKGILGEKPVARAYKDGISYDYIHSDTLEKAINNKATKEMIVTQLTKTGGTPISVQDIDVIISDGVFLSKGEINEIRRNILEGFERKYIQSFKRKPGEKCSYSEINRNNYKSGFSAYISLVEQLDAVLRYNFERVYVPFDIAVNNPEICKKIKDKLVVSLPEISTDKEIEYIDDELNKLKSLGVSCLLISNYGQIHYKDNFDIILSHRFNIWNSQALNLFNELNHLSVFLSPELNLKIIDRLKYFGQCEIIAYGKIPVMITENCIIKNMDKCPCDKDKFYYITDRMNVKFPVKSTGKYCRSVLYNSTPVYIADKIKDKGFDNIIKCLYFTTEDKDLCKKICSDYFSECSDNMPSVYTRGHLYK